MFHFALKYAMRSRLSTAEYAWAAQGLSVDNFQVGSYYNRQQKTKSDFVFASGFVDVLN